MDPKNGSKKWIQQMDPKNGTNTTTMILLIGGTLLTVGMLGVICRDIRDSISDWINRK